MERQSVAIVAPLRFTTIDTPAPDVQVPRAFRPFAKNRVVINRLKKCPKAVVHNDIACSRRSGPVLFSMTRRCHWLFFRACVALRQILSARKRPVVRRVRKATLVAILFVAASGSLRASDTLPVPTLQPSASHDRVGRPDGVNRPIRLLSTSIKPPAGELPADNSQLAAAHPSPIAPSSPAARDWQPYLFFWQSPGPRYRACLLRRYF
jgi:hypothetical protein